MSEPTPFSDLIRRIRAGDEEASTELVERYEPAIRRAVHFRLRDPGLRRIFDSVDICQSVLANFFERATSGQFALESPEQLISLLVKMARNRLTNHTLKQQAARRDYRRTEPTDCAEDLIDEVPSPEEAFSRREVLTRFRSMLTLEEIWLVEQWAIGTTWMEIVGEIGGTADGQRMRLNRAFRRVTRELQQDA